MRQVALHRTNALVRPERFSSRLVVFKGDMPAILNKEPAESIVERLYLIYSLLPYFQYFSILFPFETYFFGKVCGPFCSSVAIETRLNFSLNRPGPAREEDGKVFWKFKFLVSVFQVIFARVALKLFRPPNSVARAVYCAGRQLAKLRTGKFIRQHSEIVPQKAFWEPTQHSHRTSSQPARNANNLAAVHLKRIGFFASSTAHPDGFDQEGIWSLLWCPKARRFPIQK